MIYREQETVFNFQDPFKTKSGHSAQPLEGLMQQPVAIPIQTLVKTIYLSSEALKQVLTLTVVRQGLLTSFYLNHNLLKQRPFKSLARNRGFRNILEERGSKTEAELIWALRNSSIYKSIYCELPGITFAVLEELFIYLLNGNPDIPDQSTFALIETHCRLSKSDEDQSIDLDQGVVEDNTDGFVQERLVFVKRSFIIGQGWHVDFREMVR